MIDDEQTSIRLEALDRAVRVAISNGYDSETPETIVERAATFERFLTGESSPS